MEIEDFRVHGKDVVDYICKYLSTIEKRSVIPNVPPGYLADIMPAEAPKRPDNWSDIMGDVERLIMPGITHWQHPRFHAYFPAGNSFPSIMGDMLSDAIGCIGFSWAASPACTELEIIMIDWIAKMMNLPKIFMHSENLGGGGVLQGSASDCILVSMLSARHLKIKQVKSKIPMKAHIDPDKLRGIEGAILTKLVGYCSSLAHSSVEKAAMISFVKIRQLDIDDEFALRGATLEAAIKNDIEKKMIPFIVCATLGTTACCSFDNIQEIGAVCRKYNIWLHVDAAYAGSSFICPEFQHYLNGVEHVDSLNFNPNKFMLVNFDCSILWVRQSALITDSMIVDPVYLQHKHSSKAVDFRHWGIPLSRRFRALKLWFVIRAYGVEGLQSYIRNHVYLASEFASLVRSSDSFEIIGRPVLGLVCFRLKANSHYLSLTKQELNSINQCLIRTINESGKLHMTPSVVKDKYILRFCICSENASIEDVTTAWNIIKSVADDILKAQLGLKQWKYHMSRADIQNRDTICSVAEKLVNSVLSPHSLDHCVLESENKKIDRQSLRQPPYNTPAEEAIMNIISEKEDSSESEDENFNIDLHIHDDFDKIRFDFGDEDANHEVFICENDLGIGVDKQNSLTQLRRQTLLKMISDPAAYNQKFFKSLCFCNDLKKEMIPSPESCMAKHKKMNPKSHRCTFSVSEYKTTSMCSSSEEDI